MPGNPAPGVRQPPPVLQQAIDNAASTYNVPPDLLAGIWRIESGSTFPNPSVNGSGYGGLFGTRNWNASTQDQANMAASILHNGFVQSKGNVSEALSYYNSGRLSGGYTSVPGATTVGWIPGYGGSSGASVVSTAIGDAASGANGLARHIPGVAQVEDIGSFLGKLTDPSYLLRGLQILAGAAIAGTGVVLLARQVALAADVPSLPGGAGALTAAAVE